MRESCVYPDHGVCVVSVDNIIINHVEPCVLRFCLDHDIRITSRSRDVGNIIKHYIIDQLINQLEIHRDQRVVLNYISTTSTILGNEMIEKINKITQQILKQFKLCYINIDHPVDDFNIQHLYQVRAAVENCCVRSRSTKNIKKYLQTHHLTALSKRINNIAACYILNK